MWIFWKKYCAGSLPRLGFDNGSLRPGSRPWFLAWTCWDALKATRQPGSTRQPIKSYGIPWFHMNPSDHIWSIWKFPKIGLPPKHPFSDPLGSNCSSSRRKPDSSAARSQASAMEAYLRGHWGGPSGARATKTWKNRGKQDEHYHFISCYLVSYRFFNVKLKWGHATDHHFGAEIPSHDEWSACFASRNLALATRWQTMTN